MMKQLSLNINTMDFKDAIEEIMFIEAVEEVVPNIKEIGKRSVVDVHQVT